MKYFVAAIVRGIGQFTEASMLEVYQAPEGVEADEVLEIARRRNGSDVTIHSVDLITLAYQSVPRLEVVE